MLCLLQEILSFWSLPSWFLHLRLHNPLHDDKNGESDLWLEACCYTLIWPLQLTGCWTSNIHLPDLDLIAKVWSMLSSPKSYAAASIFTCVWCWTVEKKKPHLCVAFFSHEQVIGKVSMNPSPPMLFIFFFSCFLGFFFSGVKVHVHQLHSLRPPISPQ